MGRNRSHDLEEIIKNLKAENRNLKKQLSRKEKREQRYHDLEEKEAEAHLRDVKAEKEAVVERESCPKCKSTTLQILKIGNRKVIICNDCGYRKSHVVK